MARFAGYPYPPAVQGDQFSRDIESQSQSLAIVVDSVWILVQALENQMLRFRSDAASRVRHRHVNEIRIGLDQAGLHRYRTSRRGELDAVLHQIDQHFQDAIRVSIKKWN